MIKKHLIFIIFYVVLFFPVPIKAQTKDYTINNIPRGELLSSSSWSMTQSNDIKKIDLSRYKNKSSSEKFLEDLALGLTVITILQLLWMKIRKKRKFKYLLGYLFHTKEHAEMMYRELKDLDMKIHVSLHENKEDELFTVLCKIPKRNHLSFPEIEHLLNNIAKKYKGEQYMSMD